VNGPFFFGVADRVKDVLAVIDTPPRVFILRMRNVPAMDATGMNALMDLYGKCVRQGTTLILSGIHAQPLVVLERAGNVERIGRENLAADIDEALARAREILEGRAAGAAARPAAAAPAQS
jgi:SulP family sulfate permease